MNPGKDECLIQAIIRKYWGMIVDKIFLGFQKSETKRRGVLHFVPLRRFYDALFVPLFCRPREKCGRLWKTTWLYNVDNLRQKDIKCLWSFTMLCAFLPYFNLWSLKTALDIRAIFPFFVYDPFYRCQKGFQVRQFQNLI